MIRTKSDMNLLCQKKLHDFTDFEKRLLLFNYIYHRKGKEVHEIYKIPIGNILNFATSCHKAYRYYNNL